ncbi:hypothetical protein PAE0249 [Pyrobaculum aerophilum str. IM2]|uniref:Uncharacterized protein n=2 Tax=Pyrobaculum aerophilum TaxID=13773 RepID=Q8ZZI2_PYRAE|nr:hypothetical protein [Pyrobaculum aerophilum]AAL62657.1 hypothetical protein PAE0249 [Pyrobaculum aerophilum str. IM2]HII46710.1 hypothetical protein [Pyrobaculum aerophilum]
MFANERAVARWLAKTLKACDPRLGEVFLEGAISKERMEALAKRLGSRIPAFVAKPDLVLVVKDSHNHVLAAMELKYFKTAGRKRWRRAYREFGQPLRYYLYGFDVAVLVHVFESGIDDADVEAYSEVVGEVVEKLKLPTAYFSVKIADVERELLKAFKPQRLGLVETCYVAKWIVDYCTETRNPLLPSDKEILERRKALKAVLGLP